MLSHRVDTPLPGMFARQETFGYDDLDRLTTVHHGLPPGSLAMSMDYAANGNITYKTGLGEYSYGDGAGLHALTGVDDPDGLINNRTQTIEYNAFNKASVLIDTVDNDAYRLEIIYGPDGQRWKTVLQKNGNITKTVIFAGDYEKITENGVTRELIYLSGGGIYVRQAGHADKVYYTHTDHLGSILSITDGAGAEVFKASYDAWGKQTVTLNTIGFHRGYTGHEHLPEFGLINMNGRMYDPIVGRFLSPDPFVQAPEFSQSFNRYSYCLNNPLIYTDPTGEWFFKALGVPFGPVGIGIGAVIDAALWGATFSAGMYTAGAAFSQGGLSQNWNGHDFWRSAAVGAMSGAVTGGMGLMSPGFSVSSRSFSANLPTYLKKAAYAGLTASFSTGVGIATYNAMSEPEDRINNIGKRMFTAGLTAGLFSFGKSIYDYQTWDKLSVDKKIKEVQSKFGDYVQYDSKTSNSNAGYSKQNDPYVYLNDNALVSKRMAFTTARHELQHLSDRILYRVNSSFLPSDKNEWTNFLEIRAYKYEVQHFRMTSNMYMKAFETIRNKHGYGGFGVFTFNPFVYFNSIF